MARTNSGWRDLTYVSVIGGFVFVAIILNVWSRRFVGYALGRSIDARLTIAALGAGIKLHRPPPGLIHHTDHGSQYAAKTYGAVLTKHGLVGSMGRRGNPYDDAEAESVMKTLKVESLYPMAFEIFVAAALPRFI